MKKKKLYEVWIYDNESRMTQPMRCEAYNTANAMQQGIDYIHMWNLRGATVTKIKEVEA